MSHKYPLDIRPIYEFEGMNRPHAFFSKGHHDAAEFAEMFNETQGTELVCFASVVQQAYYRNVPNGKPMSGVSMHECAGPGMGAYPVTIWELAR